jgi:cysteine synthase/rhodanese-related sulfurtransferase
MNPFGSIKDRTALSLIQWAWEASTIIESSSGNTAKALGILASIQGKKFISVTSKIKQKEVEDILRIIDVDIRNLPPGSECPDPNDPNSPFKVIQSIIDQDPDIYYWTDQYTNMANPNVHTETTAKEIEKDIWTPDFFFSGLGTTGSSRGISEYFSWKWDMKSIGIITAGSSYIPGIRNNREMWEVGLFEKSYYLHFEEVHDTDATDAMLLLIRKTGILVWPTTWATYHGMIQYLQKQDPISLQWKKIVFIACDRLEPYTSYIREKKPGIFGEETHNEWAQALGESNTIDIIPEDLSNHLIIDMRSYDSYKIWHIRWSLSFPFSELGRYTKEGYLPFPKEKELIFVCPYGEESVLMSQIANTLLYTSYSLNHGYLEYKKRNPQTIISQNYNVL